MIKLSLLLILITKQLFSANWPVIPGFPFNPASITITAGDSVSWSGLGSLHNVAETNVLGGGASYNGGFYSGAAFGGPSTLVINPAVGNYLYFCEVHGGVNMWGHIHVLPPPTATTTITMTVTPSFTESFTSSPTPSDSPTLTESHTTSPTPTITETFTNGPSPTFSSTATTSPTPTISPSPSGSPTISPTISPTPSFSPTGSLSPSQSATSTQTQIFARSPNDKVILGPVPVKAGNPLCLAFPAAPYRTLCELYNSRGELVAREKFETQVARCIDTKNLAPGLYFANIEEEDKDQKHKRRLQKIVILP